MKSMKKLVLLTVVLAAGYFGGVESGFIPTQRGGAVSADQVLAAAFADHRSHFQAQDSGRVTRILPDDNTGRRHQRFIVRLASGQTLLVAHDIDLAERVASLDVGDQIEFYGEYDWNSRGGVIHWTHHDPRGRHLSGWIKHDGRTYQ